MPRSRAFSFKSTTATSTPPSPAPQQTRGGDDREGRTGRGAMDFRFDALPIFPPRAEEAAARGVARASAELPYLDSIQRSFGRHDLRGVRAAIGGEAREATRALSALAFTRGERIGFSGSPDLFTAAHEAAHVIQQRNGLGRSAEALEREADQAASAVLQGRSAEGALDRGSAPAGGPVASVQLRPKKQVPSTGLLDPNENDPQLVDFETKLFGVIRDNQDTYRDAVIRVTSYWRSFLRRYIDAFSLALERDGIRKLLRRPELSTPELLGQAPADVQDQVLLDRWQQLVDGAGLDSGTTDLSLFFLRIVYDTFLDKTGTQTFKQAGEILRQSFDPEQTRKVPGTAPAFANRGREKAKTPPGLQPIVGNRYIDPARQGDVRTVLPAGDPAATALVERGGDANLLNDPTNPFIQRARALGLPLAAGISGSTADYIELGRLAGLSGDALRDYAMAVLYYIGLPGHHSFHEIVSVLAANGVVRYDPRPGIGDYAGPVTGKIKASAGYRALSRQYPGLLDR